MSSKLDAIELAIQKCLNDIAEKCDSESDAVYTKAIKNAIGDIAKKHGFDVYAAESQFEENGEWLYDMTWLEMRDHLVISVPLILECEWWPAGTLDDFQKLLVGRALRRVMIHWERDEEKARKKIQTMIKQVKKFEMTQPGDRYLFACYLCNSDCFLFKQFVVQSR